jgi:hypothetical protein
MFQNVCELQGSVREGMVLFRTLLEELKKNMDLEKNTINSFCQGMQEAIAKTHASMIMEVQRYFLVFFTSEIHFFIIITCNFWEKEKKHCSL